MNEKLKAALEELSPIQRDAVNWTDDSVLVLTGPGSGKTRVLTTRIARLLDESPDRRFKILALTFTTKAAAEMRDRVERLVPGLVDVYNRLLALMRANLHLLRIAEFVVVGNVVDDKNTLVHKILDFLLTLPNSHDVVHRVLRDFRMGGVAVVGLFHVRTSGDVIDQALMPPGGAFSVF